MKKTIFITGASRGFGKIWAEAYPNQIVGAIHKDKSYI